MEEDQGEVRGERDDCYDTAMHWALAEIYPHDDNINNDAMLMSEKVEQLRKFKSKMNTGEGGSRNSMRSTVRGEGDASRPGVRTNEVGGGVEGDREWEKH